MSGNHKILVRQITKSLGNDFEISPDLQKLFDLVSRTYEHFEKDRLLLDRSMQVSSEELFESNQKLREESKQQEIVLDKLKKAIQELALEDEVNPSEIHENDLLSMFDLLQEKIRSTKVFEEELKISALKFQAVVENTKDLIWSVDECFRLNTFNSFFRQNTRLKHNKTPELGDPVSSLLPPQEYKILEDLLERAMEGEQFTIEEVRNSDDRPFYLETSFNPIIADSKVTGVSVFSRDITSRKEHEQSKNKILGDLKSANEELKQIAYITSHDLKTPLRSIGSIISWLKADYEDVLDDESKEQIAILLSRVSRLYNLIDSISLYMNIGTRNGEQKQNFSVKSIVELCKSNIHIPSNISVDYKDSIPSIRGIKSHIVMILEELMKNAIKFMDKEEGKITIHFKKEIYHYKLTVHDNGPGIEPKYQEKIFKIFQTLDVKNHAESNGIGLALVKKIININEGSIIVNSTEADGTTFTIKLPLN